MRGYKGDPHSWYSVSCCLETFIKKREFPESWKGNEDFEEGWILVTEYAKKEVIEPPEETVYNYDGYARCRTCEKRIKDHPRDENCPWLHRFCDERLVRIQE